MSISLEQMADDQPAKDFRRANGAPMVKKLNDPDKWDRYSRPSSMGGDLDDEANLTLWKIDRAMDGVAMNPSLSAAVISKQGIKEGRKELREQAINKGRGEEAADLGSALHAITHRYEREPGFKVPPPYDGDVAAYVGMLDQVGLVSEYIEVHVCSDEWRAAGTTDRIYLATKRIFVAHSTKPIEPGEFVLGDLKTGARLDYSFRGFSIQLAVYVDGCFYNVDTDERTPFPDKLRTDVALLVHMPVGQATCELHWVDLARGRDGARLVKQVRAWRKATDQIFSFVTGEPEIEEELATISATRPPDVPEHPDWPTDDEAWIEAMSPYCQRRINVLGKYSNEARNLLLRRWPDGVLPLTVQTPTGPQLACVLDLLDAIEAAYSVPWSENDPRLQWNHGLHRSQATHSNQPPSAMEQQSNEQSSSQ